MNANTQSLLDRHTKLKKSLDLQAEQMYQVRANLNTLKAQQEKLKAEALELLKLPETATVEEIIAALDKKEQEELAALEELSLNLTESSKLLNILQTKLSELNKL